MTDNITNDEAVKNAIATLTKQTILGSYADLNTAIQKSQAYQDIMLELAGNNKELADSVKTIWGALNGDEEAAAALQMLGFSKPNISKAIQKIVSSNPNIKVEELIKQALQIL